MTDCIPGERLLETARELLLDELLPALPPHTRHAALMVANAMAIAARRLNRHDGGAARDADRRLCERIRQGGVDEGAEAAKLHAWLLAAARAGVEISNPKYLGPRTGAHA